jgi:phage terminase large subunit GpA-like protein
VDRRIAADHAREESRPREAEYAHCGALIGERYKTWMLEHGAWRPTAEGDGRSAGCHLSSRYSPVGWFGCADAAETYEQTEKSPDLMKGFRQHGAEAPGLVIRYCACATSAAF